MKKTKFRINKKAQFDDMADFIVSIIVIVLIGILIGFIVKNKVANQNNVFQSDINVADASFMTRTILDSDVKPGYKVYQLVLDSVNNKDLTSINKDFTEIISKFYPNEKITEQWIVRINFDTTKSFITFVNPGSKKLSNTLKNMPGVIIPNPQGKNVEVLLKPIRPIDYKGVQSQKYVSNYQNPGDPTSTYDGKALVKLNGFTNIECDEDPSTTNYGRICEATPNLKAKLDEVDKYLKEHSYTMQITQAYRTWGIQNALYQNNIVNKPKSEQIPTCYPGKSSQASDVKICPHMTGGAVDIQVYDENGKLLNAKNNPKGIQTVKSMMCEFGFIKFAIEPWHFEYGTYKWSQLAGTKKDGKQVCSYG